MTGTKTVRHFMHLCLLCATLWVSIALGPAPSAKVLQDLATPAGPLVIAQLDGQALGSEFYVSLAGREVMHSKEGDDGSAFPDFPVPRVITFVRHPIGSFDAVVVFQQSSWGNACDGGPIWFLGIHRDGSFMRSKPIDFCGGPPPHITVDHDVLHLTIPASDQGSSDEEWTYAGGAPVRIH